MDIWIIKILLYYFSTPHLGQYAGSKTSFTLYLSLSYFGISLIYTVLNLIITLSHAVLMTALLESFDQTSTVTARVNMTGLAKRGLIHAIKNI